MDVSELRSQLWEQGNSTIVGAMHRFYIVPVLILNLLLQATTTPTVQEVNDQADDQPYNKANEGDPGQAHNQHQRTNYGEDGNQLMYLFTWLTLLQSRMLVLPPPFPDPLQQRHAPARWA